MADLLVNHCQMESLAGESHGIGQQHLIV